MTATSQARLNFVLGQTSIYETFMIETGINRNILFSYTAMPVFKISLKGLVIEITTFSLFLYMFYSTKSGIGENQRGCGALHYSQLPDHQNSLMAARAIPLSACHLGPPSGNGTRK